MISAGQVRKKCEQDKLVGYQTESAESIRQTTFLQERMPLRVDLQQKQIIRSIRMDRELAQILDHEYRFQYYTDLLKIVHISNMSNKESSAVSRSFVRKLIAQRQNDSSYSRRPFKCYRINNITDSQDMKILKWAFEVQPHLVEIKLWNIDVSKNMIEVLKALGSKLERLWIHGCHFSKNIGVQLGMLNLRSLKMLRICSGPLTNKSLKMIIKARLSCLEQVYLENTSLTTDFVKPMRKINHNLFSIHFIGQSKANSNVVVRQTISLVKNHPYGGLIGVSPFYSPHDYVYPCWLAKKQSMLHFCLQLLYRSRTSRVYSKYKINRKMFLSSRTCQVARQHFII